MSQLTELIDGSKSIDQQENDLNFLEQARIAKVVSYSKGTSGTTNQVGLQFLTLSEPQPPPLSLSPAGQGGPPPGCTVVFQSSVFVEGVEKDIVGSRQTAAVAAGAKPLSVT